VQMISDSESIYVKNVGLERLPEKSFRFVNGKGIVKKMHSLLVCYSIFLPVVQGVSDKNLHLNNLLNCPSIIQ
jgi:hypothetical protein